MKFLVDAQLPPGLCGWLEDRGHAAVHVGDLADEALREKGWRCGYGMRHFKLCIPTCMGHNANIESLFL